MSWLRLTHVSQAFHRISTAFLAVFHRFSQETLPRKRLCTRVGGMRRSSPRCLSVVSLAWSEPSLLFEPVEDDVHLLRPARPVRENPKWVAAV